MIRTLVTTNEHQGNLGLKRSNTAAEDDTFGVFPFPVVAVNPDFNKANHLYIAYADKGQNPGDKADVFFINSTDGGATWNPPLRISSGWNNDQWMPVLAVKPDGTKLFLAWYDRRNDPDNSLIDVYGRWATISTGGSVSFDAEFRITTSSFPPVFAGTLSNNTHIGHYDPVYPPGGVNLHWHYPDWPDEESYYTGNAYKGHVGEYNGACTDESYVYMTWADHRLPAAGTLYGRSQGDIRLVRFNWP
jgi:hypothetical protein